MCVNAPCLSELKTGLGVGGSLSGLKRHHCYGNIGIVSTSFILLSGVCVTLKLLAHRRWQNEQWSLGSAAQVFSVAAAAAADAVISLLPTLKAFLAFCC